MGGINVSGNQGASPIGDKGPVSGSGGTRIRQEVKRHGLKAMVESSQTSNWTGKKDVFDETKVTQERKLLSENRLMGLSKQLNGHITHAKTLMQENKGQQASDVLDTADRILSKNQERVDKDFSSDYKKQISDLRSELEKDR